MKKFVKFAALAAVRARAQSQPPCQVRPRAAVTRQPPGDRLRCRRGGRRGYCRQLLQRQGYAERSYAYSPSECRVIIRHHLNRFGERVTVRERVCD